MKKFFGFLFKSLFSNKAVVEGKKQPIWTAIIVGVLSIMIAVVPTIVNTLSMKGSAIVTSSPNASVDTSLTLFSKYLVDNNLTMKVVDGKLETNFKKTMIEAQGKKLLAVEYVADDTKLLEAETPYLEYYVKTDEDSTKTISPISHMLITNTRFYIYTYAEGATNTLKKDGETISSYAKTLGAYQGDITALKDTDFASFYKNDGSEVKVNCVNSWKTTLNKMYEPLNQRYTLSYSLIICGLNTAVILIVSVMLFVLTKLKSNQGEKLSFLSAIKVGCFAGLSPALLTLIIGFFIPFITSVGFVLFLGLRSTFLGIKATSVPQEAPKK